MKVEWLPAALADRDAIVAYLEGRNTAAAVLGHIANVLVAASRSSLPHCTTVAPFPTGR